MKDPNTWIVRADGKLANERPSYANAKALENMEKHMAEVAARTIDQPWFVYGHMGDEPSYENDFSPSAREGFRAKYGYEMPAVKNDFSPAYLVSSLHPTRVL